VQLKRSSLNIKSSKIFRLLLVVFMLTLFTGCIRATDVGKSHTESRSVQLGDAESVEVEIIIGVGELMVAGGAANLLEANFVYNVAEWTPEVRYSAISKRGYLTIKQPSDVVDIPLGKIQYEWDLRLNKDIPMDLSIILGAGDNTVNLEDLSLTSLDIITGAGTTTIDLRGDWQYDLDISLKGGVGDATLRLPSDVGIHVDITGGVGKISAGDMERVGRAYVNDAYGEAEVTLGIDIVGGVGTINLELD